MAFTDLHEEIAATFARLEGQTSGLVADGISLVEVKSFETERERLREYAKTPLGKARRAQYMSTDRGKEVRRNSQKRRLATPEGREAKKKWDAAYRARRRGLDAQGAYHGDSVNGSGKCPGEAHTCQAARCAVRYRDAGC